MEKLEKKKSKKKGCLIIFAAIFGVLLIIGVIGKDDDDKKPSSGTNTTIVDEGYEKLKDSLKLRDLDVLSQKIQKIKGKFKEEYDDIEGITWIYPNSKPVYTNSKAFYVYLGLSDKDQVWKRLVIRYHGDSWLFLQKIIIKTDNNTYTLNANNSKRDHNADVWEWIDIQPTTIEDIIINDIIGSKTTKVRFVGKQYHNDWTLTPKEIKGLKDIEEYYSLLEQTYNLKHVLN